jgi:hypothetical protein
MWYLTAVQENPLLTIMIDNDGSTKKNPFIDDDDDNNDDDESGWFIWRQLSSVRINCRVTEILLFMRGMS